MHCSFRLVLSIWNSVRGDDDNENNGTSTTSDTISGYLTDITPYMIEVEEGDGAGFYYFNSEMEITAKVWLSEMSSQKRGNVFRKCHN